MRLEILDFSISRLMIYKTRVESMKKTLKIASIMLSVAILSLATMTGCVPDPLPEYESGYFRYAVSTEDDGSKKAYLIGLTELGEQQKILVYPEYIDQIKVYGLGYEIPKLFYNDLIGGFANSQLEKFYFPETPLESVVGNLSLSFPNAYPVWWDSARRNNKILFGEGAVFGFNYYREYFSEPFQNSRSYIANVSYMYNYAGAENDGYYWVDSYDEAVITFIPPDPERLGYLFDGWYKEPACINPWNFETDKTGELLNIREGMIYESYDGIYLYAKWVRNS